MTRIPAIVLLVVGAVLLAVGWDEYNSIGSGISRVFTGTSTNRTVILLVAGAVTTLLGIRRLKP